MKQIYFLISVFVSLYSVDSSAQCSGVTNSNCTVKSVSAIDVGWQALTVTPDIGYHVQYKTDSEPFFSKTASKFGAPWINEVRYRSATGITEGYEIAGPSGMDLDCYEIWPFQASQDIPPPQNIIQQLSGTFVGAASSYYFDANWYNYSFQAVGGALALIYNADDCNCPGTTEVIQYIQFGVNYASKPAIQGVLPTVVATPTPLPIAGESLALIGSGDTPDDYSWQFSAVVTDGDINDNQTIVSIENQSIDTISLKHLFGCTAYNFRIRPISACGTGSFGSWDTTSTCQTPSNVSPGSIFTPGGAPCSNITICTGDSTGFDCITEFKDHNNILDSCIDVTYFITRNDTIVNFYFNPTDLNLDIPNLPEGIYEINVIGHNQTITNYGIDNDINNVLSSGCINTLFSPVSLKIYDTPTITNTQLTKPSTCNGTDGEIFVTTSSSIGTYKYRLINTSIPEQSTGQFSGLSANTYVMEIRVLEAPFCVVTETFDIFDPGSPILSIATSGPVCKNDSATVDLTVSGTSGPFVYIWSNGATTEDVILPDGSYTVTVSNPATNCPSTASVTITEPAVALSALVLNVSDVLCFGQSNGEATAAGNGGVPPYSYIWSNGETNATTTGLTPGAYSFTVTDDNGCTDAFSININGAPLLYFDFVSTDTIKCFGDCTANLSASVSGGTPPYIYHWSNNQFGPTINNVCAGTYTISVTDINNCQIVDSVVVYQNTKPNHILTLTNPLCTGDNNGSVAISVSGGTPPYMYFWPPNQSSTPIPSASQLPAGQYFFTVIDDLNCQVADSSFKLVDPTPIVTFITGESLICETDTTLLVASAIGGNCTNFTFDWGTTQAPDIMVSPIVDNTVYFVTATDCNGCLSDTSFVMNIEEFPRNLQDTIEITVDNGDPFTIDLDSYFDQDSEYIWYADYVSDLIATADKDTIGTTSDELNDEFVLIAEEFDVVRVVTYEIVAYSELGNCEGESLVIIIKLNPFGDLVEEVIADIITPNGDGRNDDFLVRFVNEEYQDAVIRIYNRSGAQVFEGTVGDSDNSWNGTFNNTGEKLPNGTYWYTIIDENNILRKGAVTMIGSN